MFLPKPKTLKNALSPMVVASWFLGYGIFEYPFGHPRPWASLCWSIINAVSYLIIIIVSEIRSPEVLGFPKSGISDRIYKLGISTNIALVLIIMLRSRMWEKKTLLCLQKMSAIDDNLKMLGVPEDYSSIFKIQIVQLGAHLFLLSIATVIASTVYADNFESRLACFCYFTGLCYGSICVFLVDMRMCELIRCVGRCFERLNNCLVQTAAIRSYKPNQFHLNSDQHSMTFPMSHEIHGNARLFAATGEKWMIYILGQTRIIHRDLCVLGKEINSAFGVHILMSIFLYVVNVTSVLFSVWNLIDARENLKLKYQTVGYAGSFAWLSMQLTKLFQIIYICSKTSSQAHRTSKLIYEFLSSTANDDIGQEIHSLSLQLVQKPLLFTAGGMFKLDFGFLIEIGGLIATYVVTMMQMNTAYET